MTVGEFYDKLINCKLNISQEEKKLSNLYYFYALNATLRIAMGQTENIYSYLDSPKSGKKWSEIANSVCQSKMTRDFSNPTNNKGLNEDKDDEEINKYVSKTMGLKNTSSLDELAEVFGSETIFRTKYTNRTKDTKKIDQTVDVRTFIKYLLKEGKIEMITENGRASKTNITEMIINGACRQIIFTGAPGTGKTRIAKEIAKDIGGSYHFVHFHPSYDYTDFVEGLRPVEGANHEMKFVKLDGIFKKFCREVVEANKIKKNKDKIFFFIIDEINRANLSKVFGELMYCFEKDKRGIENRVKTQYRNLPTYDVEKGENGGYLAKDEDVFAKGFYIPENVCIIGTMNDIDRSVDSMDFALRRRFEWVEFKVTPEMLEDAFGHMGIPKKKELAENVMALNGYIQSDGAAYGLNRQYFISQGQFANLPKDKKNSPESIKKYVWEYRIQSLLREYLRGEDESSIETFIDEANKKFFSAGNKSEAES